MTALSNRTHSNAELFSPAQRAENQMADYWRVRTTTTLDRLEREARRMLQLEEELSQFATHYYAAVGAATERLAEVEQRLALDAMPDEVTSAIPAVLAQCDVKDARRSELKTRYRTLAKEIHPDRAMVTEGNGLMANAMHTLNAAYQHGDLAALLKLEAQMLITGMMETDMRDTTALEQALRDIDRAANTYAEGYRAMLGSPLNELMLRAMSAKLAGWDWIQAVVRKIERTIEEKERAAVMASIAAIGEWRETVGAA